MTTTGGTTAPVAEGLFTWPAEQPRLIGSECAECGAVAFPRQPSCSRCTSTSMLDRELATGGTLWSWTVQRFEPKEPYAGPQPFEPYGVGYVELPDGVLVESRLTTADPDQLEIGQPMELVVVPFSGGTVTFAFRPAVDA